MPISQKCLRISLEAAQIDGANFRQKLFYIIIPYLKPTFAVLAMLTVTNGLRLFDLIWVMTQGGPGGASDVMTSYIYTKAFTNRDFGAGTAASVILMLIMVAIMAVKTIVQKKRAGEDFMMNKKNVYKLFLFLFMLLAFLYPYTLFCGWSSSPLRQRLSFWRVSGPCRPVAQFPKTMPRPGTDAVIPVFHEQRGGYPGNHCRELWCLSPAPDMPLPSKFPGKTFFIT